MQTRQSLRDRISHLYTGNSESAHRFRYALLALDILTILFLIISSFFYDAELVEWLDIIFGLYVACDYFSRLWIAPHKTAFALNPLNIADLIAMLSFLAPILGGNLGFLRALRVLRLMRSYRMISRLREDFDYFKHHEDIIFSGLNLLIFIFLMTELVFVIQVDSNPNVQNFLDAMYFTVAALTTTDFGDVTLQGQSGRLLSIVIMIFGVSLFLKLIQTIFRPSKVRFICKSCGLFLHERDAIHCKHCGTVLHIPNEGNA